MAESIIDSVQPDPSILHKYSTLKTALLNKTTVDPLSQQLSTTKRLLTTYKYLTSSLLDAITQFETQIEH